MLVFMGFFDSNKSIKVYLIGQIKTLWINLNMYCGNKVVNGEKSLGGTKFSITDHRM